jgi:hypothetical protein
MSNFELQESERVTIGKVKKDHAIQRLVAKMESPLVRSGSGGFELDRMDGIERRACNQDSSYASVSKATQ